MRKSFDDIASALKEADLAVELFKQSKRTGKVHGLPITIKECLDLKGTATTLGLMRRKNDIRCKTLLYCIPVYQNPIAIRTVLLESF